MGHYDLDYEMEDELRQIKAAEETYDRFEITFKFTDNYLGRVYTIKDQERIMLVCLGPNDKLYILPGDYGNLEEELAGFKWVRKALKAFKVSKYNL